MSDISTQATVNIDVNNKPAGRKIAELENKMDNLVAKKRQFEAAGDQKGLVRTQKEINKVSRQLDNARTASARCQAALAKLNEASPKELRNTLRQLKNDLDHMERGSKAWNAQVEAIKRVKAEIKLVDAELHEHESLLSRINRKVNEWGMSVASAAAAFTGLIFTARQAVQAYADMEAEMANVRKFTGMTAEEVERLNEAFKRMDTRTSREDLNKLAQEAGRLGLQSEEDVLGFVTAANQINVALDDLGEGATLTLSKLTDIFGDKDRLGVEQSLLSVGSVINELSQNCTASAPYLAQFAQRLAGVGKQANMTIPEIMGFAAVLDSQGQAVEMSATAMSQLIMKLFQDPAKIAKATGMDLQAFNKVLQEDTNEALLMLLDRLHELGDISVLAPVFDAMGTDGARASQVIAALAGNVEEVKKQQLEANKAFEEGTSVTKEYDVQNNTVQAQLDKAKKGFHDMAVELGEKLAPAMKYAISGTSAMMHVLSSVISFVYKYKWGIAALIVTLTAYTVAVNADVIALKAMYLWEGMVNGVHKIGIVVKNAARLSALALSVAYNTVRGNALRAAAAQRALSAAMATTPWGAIIAVVGSLASAIIGLATSTEVATKRTEELDEATRHLTWEESEQCKQLVDEKVKIRELLQVAEDEQASKEDRQKAINDLNKICPDYNGYLSQEGALYVSNKKALDEYLESLERRMRMAYYKDEYEKYLRAEEKANFDLIKAQDEVDKASGGNNHVKMKLKNEKGETVEIDWDQAAMREANKYGISQDQVGGLATPVGTAVRIRDEAKKAHDIAVADTKNFERLVEKAGFKPSELIGSDTNVASADDITGGGSHFTPPNDKAAKAAAAEAKKREAEEKKRKAEEEKQKRLAAALEKKEFKDAIEVVEKNLKDQNRVALDAYNNGEIDYVTYLERKQAASKEYYEAAEKVYKKFNAEESEDLAKLRLKKAEEDKKFDEEHLKLLEQRYAAERDAAKIAAQMDFYDHNNTEAYKNQRMLDNKLAQIDIEYLRNVLAVQKKESQEYETARRNLAKAEREEELRQRKQLETDLSAWLYIYSQRGAKERMEAELRVAKELYDQKLLKEEEYQEAVKAIQDKYRDEVNGKTGTKAKNQDFTDAADIYNKQLAALEDARKQGLISQEDYESRRWQIIQSYHGKIVELVKGEGDEWGSMIANLVETWKAGFEDLGSTLPEKLKTIGDMAAAAFAVMNAGIKSYTDYANASRDLEVKKAEASYDAQIKAAGSNEKKQKQLEEAKQKEIAKIKTKYDKRAMAMEMAQAVASTAMGAINAYASAAKIPAIGYILAPIAASMALAAGALQIATIKKSHQTQQMGYYEGGFTGRDGDNHREVGVVHANEFVANHKAVANPELLPVLRLIDQAQRNNTIGSLTSEDVSRAIGQGAILGDMTVNQQRTADREDRSMQLVAASMEQQTAAINELNSRLADGIESFMVMDGERGFDRSWQRYQRMKNNPRR